MYRKKNLYKKKILQKKDIFKVGILMRERYV